MVKFTTINIYKHVHERSWVAKLWSNHYVMGFTIKVKYLQFVFSLSVQLGHWKAVSKNIMEKRQNKKKLRIDQNGASP